MATDRASIIKERIAACPDMSPTGMAVVLMFDHPDTWENVEHARNQVRYYMAKNGDHNREGMAEASRPPLRTPTECRILNMDIETAPMLAFVWGCFKQFVSPEQLLEPSQVLCWCAKWLGKDEVMYDGMNADIKPNGHVLDFYGYSDERVVRGLWKLFDEADIIVGHNGRAFDAKTMNARWIKHGLVPPSPYRFIDTLTMVKDTTRLPRNKLESVGRYFAIGKKLEHEGFSLWTKCMEGDPEAWAKMRSYNEQDVRLDEEAYMLFRPWYKRHPNVALYYQDGQKRCIVCGGLDVQPEHGHDTYTNASVFPSFRCGDCGWVGRSRKRNDPVGEIEDRLAHSL